MSEVRRYMERKLAAAEDTYESLQQAVRLAVSNDMESLVFERNLISTLTIMIQVREEITAYKLALDIRE